MNTLLRPLFVLLLAVASLSGCKKEEPTLGMPPKSSIIFDDASDKTGADYRKGGDLTLKVGISGAATSVRITSTYSAGGAAKTVELGPFPVSGGAATISIPASQLRAAADGPIVGAATVANPIPTPLPTGTTAASFSRANNTYVLLVDAIAPDGSTERRFFTAVILL
jgi:hypothetical protein